MNSQMKIFFLFLFTCLIHLLSFAAVRGDPHHVIAFEGDLVLLRRANASHHALVMEQTTKTTSNPLTPDITSQVTYEKNLMGSNTLVDKMRFDLGISAAAKLFATIYSTWEFRFTGPFNWKSTDKVSSLANNLQIPGSFATETHDYIHARKMRGKYISNFWNAEFNYWRHVTPRFYDFFSVSCIAGFRFFQVHEKIHLDYIRENNISYYKVSTKDWCFGPQVGLDIEYNPYRLFTWGLVLKVGGLFNSGKGKSTMTDLNNTITILKTDASDSNFAYFVQGYPFFEFRPIKFFTLFANYQALYLGAIVTSYKQVRFYKSKDKLNHGGNIIYHGLTTGVQFNF